MDEPESATLSDREQRILAAMRAGAFTIREVAAATNIPSETTRRALLRLWQAGKVNHLPNARPAWRVKISGD